MAYGAIDNLEPADSATSRVGRGAGAPTPIRGRPLLPQRSSQHRTARLLTGSALAAIFLGNVVAIIWLWLHNGGISGVHSPGDAATSAGRITGLLGTWALLVQVILLVRLRPLERLVGLDRLSVWHRLNGKIALGLIVAHVVLITAGYAATDHLSPVAEFATLLTQYADMLSALIGTVLLVLVVATSLAIVRGRLRYQTWFLVHLMAYLGVILSWSHQPVTGNEFAADTRATAYWSALYFGTLGLVILFRLAWPLLLSLRLDLRVQRVVQEAPDIHSVVIEGRDLDRLGAHAGQFCLWRFLTPDRFWEAHPFSLSAAPNGTGLRITVKGLGDFTRRIGTLQPGTRILVEGPFGVFTDAARRREGAVLIAGGIGITPIRALAEEMEGDLVVLYRTMREEEILFREELDRLAHNRGITVHYLVGDHAAPEHRHLLGPEHLLSLVPNIARRDVYVCGPPTMMRIVRSNALALGVPARCIHTEEFAL